MLAVNQFYFETEKPPPDQTSGQTVGLTRHQLHRPEKQFQ